MASNKQNAKVKTLAEQRLRASFAMFASTYDAAQGLELVANVLESEAENYAALDHIHLAEKYQCAANRLRLAAHDIIGRSV